MAGNFTLESCMRRYSTKAEKEDPSNSLHKCWSCKLAYGQCEWSRVDEKAERSALRTFPAGRSGGDPAWIGTDWWNGYRCWIARSIRRKSDERLFG